MCPVRPRVVANGSVRSASWRKTTPWELRRGARLQTAEFALVIGFACLTFRYLSVIRVMKGLRAATGIKPSDP